MAKSLKDEEVELLFSVMFGQQKANDVLKSEVAKRCGRDSSRFVARINQANEMILDAVDELLALRSNRV